MFYFDVNRATTSNATPGTENNTLRALTVANQRTCLITGMYVSARMAAAGGLIVRLKTFGTAGSGGTAYTPGERDSDGPSASTTWFTDATTITGGTTATIHAIAGCSAQGGFGGWYAGAPEQALAIKANGGAAGNAEVTNVSGLASTNFDVNMEFAET